jgi:fatty-acyl-CoA synthase
VTQKLTLPALLDRHLVERPHACAFIEAERRISYAQFDALGRKTAAWLLAQGVRPGDRVAVWLVNRIEWLALLFGLARIGAALVAVNTRFRAAELEHVLRRSGARMLVLEPSFKKIDFPAILADVDPAAAQFLERVAVARPPAGALSREVLGKPTVAFDAFEREDADVPDRSDPEAIVALFTTSGTTKGPKLVMHPQRSIAHHARAVARGFGFDAAGSRALAAIPFCGVFGFDLVLGALTAGAPAVIMDTFEAHGAVELVARHEITHLFGSDEMARRMMELVAGHDPFPSVRLFGYAAFQPGSAELGKAGWARRIPLVGLYGSSEAQALFAFQPLDLPLDRRIEPGGLPVAGKDAEIRVRDVDSGELVEIGRSGEIEIRAPSLFAGYCNDAEATAAAMRPDGFFRTGDIGRLRADGSFVFETRRGDAIRLGGFLVSPAEIEDALKRIPAVADAQVVGVELGGQTRCAAFVIPAAGSAPSEAGVIAGAAAVMAGFKVPARVWFLEAFPVTQSANGTKIQRNKLREMAMERLRRSDAA